MRNVFKGGSKFLCIVLCFLCSASFAVDFPKPYDKQCTQREDVFAFTRKPAVRYLGNDRYEITFSVKGYCDVAIGLVDKEGKVIRHLGAGVLGKNAPHPFKKKTLNQTVFWDGKDDLGEYVKEPTKLHLHVGLGLKPTFHKRLGGSSPYNLPGFVHGIAIGPKGAYVFTQSDGQGHLFLRKFDHDGQYVSTLHPPPPGMPTSKLGGKSYVEYERGKRSVMGADIYRSVAERGHAFPPATKKVGNIQPALANDRLIFTDHSYEDGAESKFFYVYTDGSTDKEGMAGHDLARRYKVYHRFPRLAATPDGKKFYMLGLGSKGKKSSQSAPVVLALKVDGTSGPTVFCGDLKNTGSDNNSLNNPTGIDCGAKGKVYVADQFNNRIQIFSPEGTFLKSVSVSRPALVRVHKKSGALYVLHWASVKGRSIGRLTKFSSYPKLKEEMHIDGIVATSMAVDSWSRSPRVWIGGEHNRIVRSFDVESRTAAKLRGVRLYEEQATGFKKIMDFDERAKKDDGKSYAGRWPGGSTAKGYKIVCDPTRERAYYHHRNSRIFDLKTGHALSRFKPRSFVFSYDDMAIDKRGFMHVHFNPGFYLPGVGRVDPSRVQRTTKAGEASEFYEEIPYNYGISVEGKKSWKGILPAKDQQGAHFFQFGIGVNMRGDVAETSCIYYVPKMEEVGYAESEESVKASGSQVGKNTSYKEYMKRIKESEKRGESVYFIPRRPGIPLSGGTIWTFDWNGELRQECAVTAGKVINGAMIDEAGSIYFVTARPRMFGKRYFLSGQGGTFNAPESKKNRNPYTGTLIKTKPKTRCSVLLATAAVPMNPMPTRPPDLMSTSWPDAYGEGNWAWVEGAEWLYAGASPIIANGCKCPTQRLHVDWYKRTFVPEAYRHSIGVLDSAGNLIMHLGSYGNFDSGLGKNSQVRVGGDDIGLVQPRAISGTDNYLAFDDWGERLTVLKLGYHAEETAGIKSK